MSSALENFLNVHWSEGTYNVPTKCMHHIALATKNNATRVVWYCIRLIAGHPNLSSASGSDVESADDNEYMRTIV